MKIFMALSVLFSLNAFALKIEAEDWLTPELTKVVEGRESHIKDPGWILDKNPDQLKTYRFLVKESDVKRPRNRQYLDPAIVDDKFQKPGIKGSFYKADNGKDVFCVQTNQLWLDKKVIVTCLGKEVADKRTSEKLFVKSAHKIEGAVAIEVAPEICPPIVVAPVSAKDESIKFIEDILSFNPVPKPVALPVGKVCETSIAVPKLALNVSEEQFATMPAQNWQNCAKPSEDVIPEIKLADSCGRLSGELLLPKNLSRSVSMTCRLKSLEDKFENWIQVPLSFQDDKAKSYESRIYLTQGPGQYECKLKEGRNIDGGNCIVERKLLLNNEADPKALVRKDLSPSERVPGTDLATLEQIETEALKILADSKAKTDDQKLKAIMGWFALHMRPTQTLPQGSPLLEKDPQKSHAVATTWKALFKDGKASGVGYGYCQQYALLSCTMARTMGIPCKVVTGPTQKAGHGWAELSVGNETWFMDGGNEILMKGSRPQFFGRLKAERGFEVLGVHGKQDYQ